MAQANVNRQARFDLLRIPGLRRLLLWKHSRTAAQLVVFTLAAMMIVDGLFGTPLAGQNTATVAAWVHYRGFIIVALLLVGNLFCAVCPFMISRKLARWIGRPRQRWPRALRNKWLALGALLAMLFVYELFDLWSSPWLTAWVIVGFFVAAFVLEALFTRDSFCMYVCPLGSFNFLYSTISPTQITSRNLHTCRDCQGKECINGRYDHQDVLLQQGCQLELYVPLIQSNLNCTLCLDCAKACPYDNVALAVRPPGEELFRQTWPHRLDLALLAMMAAFTGLMNAFGMTPPVYVLEQQVAVLLQTRQEVIVLGLVFAAIAVGLPLALGFGAAALNRLSVAADRGLPLKRLVMRYAYAFVPIGFGIWTAHYLFHLLLGLLTLIPAIQRFFEEVVGAPLLGPVDWTLAARLVPPLEGMQAIQLAALGVGTAVALAVAWRAARKAHGQGAALVEALPWAVILVALAATAVYVFLLPMEMRGSVLG